MTSRTSGTMLEPAPAVQEPVIPAAPSVPVRLVRSLTRASTVLPVVTLLALLGIWEAASRTGVVNAIVLPAPTKVVAALYELCGDGVFWHATGVTAWETLAGLLLGCSVAMILGTAIGLVTVARRALYPLVVAFQTMPRIALAPLFLVWFGFGLTPRIMFAATICFFPVLIAVIVGLQTVDSQAASLMRSFGASRWQTYRKLAFPSSLPVVFGGLKTSVTLALIGAIVGEFVGGNEGMGVLIDQFNFQLNVDQSFAVILALAIFGLVLYAIVDLIDQKVVYWRQHH